jgi:hypothetical protein
MMEEKIKENKMGITISKHGRVKNRYIILGNKFEWKRPRD